MAIVLHAKTRPVLKDQWILKKIGDKYELTWYDMIPESGWVCDIPSEQIHVHDEKLKRNLTRARNKVFEFAYCNAWDWFFTGTLDPTKQDRSDLEGFRRRFSQLVRNLKRRDGLQIDYLIIPELHADLENWHCHGLIRGIPDSQLQTINGKLSWSRYGKVFGFNDLQLIRNHEAVSKYLTKYITKTIGQERGVCEVFKNCYFHSQGLKQSEIIKIGQIQEISLTDLKVNELYSTDHIKKYSVSPDMLSDILNSITG